MDKVEELMKRARRVMERGTIEPRARSRRLERKKDKMGIM